MSNRPRVSGGADMEPRRQRLSQRRKAAERSAIVRSQSEVRRDQTELADLFRPQAADPVGALPRASQSVDAGPADLDAALLVDGFPEVASSPQLEPTRPTGAKSTIMLDAIPAGSRRVKRLAVLGALAVVITGGAASAQLVSSPGAPVPVVDPGAPAPVAVIPASELGNSTSIPDDNHTAPVVAPIKNAESAVPSAPVAAPEPRVTRNANRGVTPSRPKHDAATMASEPDRRASSAEAYARSRVAERLSEHDHRWARFISPRP